MLRIGFLMVILAPGAIFLIGVMSSPSRYISTSLAAPPQTRLTELRGELAIRRESDLWVIRSVSQVLNSRSREQKILVYCLNTVRGAEQLTHSQPTIEYTLRPDGTVFEKFADATSKTPEQIFRDSERAQFALETGGGPVVQDCAGKLWWFGTWHNSPMPSDQEFLKNAAKARADLNEIDNMLDSRLVEVLSKPDPLPNVGNVSTGQTAPANRPPTAPTQVVCTQPLLISRPNAPDDRRAPPARMTAEYVIDENGAAIDITFPSTPDIQTTDRVLADAWVKPYQDMIRENLAQWKFQPSLCNGAPTKHLVHTDFNFHYR